jgi:hypothetical protein
LDATKPYYVSSVRFGSDRLVYLYLNFKNPELAASYFQNYNTLEGDIVASRVKIAQSGTSLQVNDSLTTTDALTGATLLNSSKVVNTGNILAYDGSNYTLYGANTGEYEYKIKNEQTRRTRQFHGLCTTLNKSMEGNFEQDLTPNLVVYNYFRTNADKKNKSFPITINGELQQFGVNVGAADDKDAFIIGADGDVWLTESGVYYGSSGVGESAAPDLTNKDPNFVSKNLEAGIVIAAGDVHVRKNFRGLIIASGDIYVHGGYQLNSSPLSVMKVLQNSVDVVQPYFTKNPTGDDGGLGDPSKFIKIIYKDWKKD